MNGETKVHNEWDYRIVPSSHGPDTNYRVFLGDVDWHGHTVVAYSVFVQYGNTPDWEEAKRRNEIWFQRPAHIVEEDLDRVLEALAELREQRQSGR